GIGIFFFAYRRRGVAGAAITAALGLVLALVVAWNFTVSSSLEKSSSLYVADSAQANSPSEAPLAGRAARDGEWNAERYGKVAVRDPVSDDAPSAELTKKLTKNMAFG